MSLVNDQQEIILDNQELKDNMTKYAQDTFTGNKFDDIYNKDNIFPIPDTIKSKIIHFNLKLAKREKQLAQTVY